MAGVDTRRSIKMLAFGGFAVVLIVSAVAAWHFLVSPLLDQRLTESLASDAQYRVVATVADDDFSGYAPLRSPEVQQDLKAQGIKLDFRDDGANYAARLEALKTGEADLAVFTVDSLVKSAADAGGFPGLIVLAIDESVGADGCVAHVDDKGQKPATLDTPATKFYGTPDSPSEFIARVARADLQFNALAGDWFVATDGAADAFNRFRIDVNPTHLYCMWEPYLSMSLSEPAAYAVFDTSMVHEYVVDVLVARREFLAEHPDVVEAVIAAHLRATYRLGNDPKALTELLIADAKDTKAGKFSESQAGAIAKGVRFTNTLENYARFGLIPPAEARGLSNWEDIFRKVVRVYVETGAIRSDPFNGDYSALFHSKTTLANLQLQGFHPVANAGAVPGLESGDLDAIRGVEELPALAEEQWTKMSVVGNARVEPISFRRAASELEMQGARDLDQLVMHLRSWSSYYITVVGHARAEGDPEANLALAKARAETAAKYITDHGVNPNRVRAVGARPSGHQGAAQSVTFALMQPSY
ncbi:hypothetical protein A2348_03050 [Candidatus Uhrbacteria bacterium RIFOXYB12_FULL_58_10]|uniref:OmpA-like domain-containing protein n=1 Tax=Candidatus Uhrbacteria bacterium RIFOXYB2_FULL_57_15 TaxID=1802422 RepID=A0A1F7W6G7_9BACT|nr:MAG: hypothetical protein A2348_03050 [Candidatus Uhrbacteria bacterium RIFOXYB12_FULL_58_10]OGL98413.1 MAG: hypothetical protein A2304_01835 [Candidatus Uhrbacteria bacterium RIFOXYB2_FULL_57_15]